MESEKEKTDKPREDGHRYVHTVPELPYKDKQNKEKDKPKRQTKQEFGLTWD